MKKPLPLQKNRFIPRMTPELERLLGTVEKDIKEEKNLSPALSSEGEIEDYLNS